MISLNAKDDPWNQSATVLDSLRPDWNARCIVCGAKPCVTGVANGKIVVETQMCGPCTWGEAETADPETW